MGLDQYLEAHIFVSKYSKKELHDKLSIVLPMINGKPDGYITVGIEVAYWRKANAIHGWFVDNVQNGEDDCRSYEVSREQLMELLDLCKKILAIKDDPDREKKAEALMPHREGFFFGSYDYDDYYFQDLQDTVDQLTEVLKMDESVYFKYGSSW